MARGSTENAVLHKHWRITCMAGVMTNAPITDTEENLIRTINKVRKAYTSTFAKEHGM